MLPPKQAEAGRATKYAAFAYQAKINLYRAYKQNADNTVASVDQNLLNDVVTQCDEAISKGGYDLLQDFQQLSMGEFDNSVESVFAVQYSIADGTDLGRINWSNLLNVPVHRHMVVMDFFNQARI